MECISGEYSSLRRLVEQLKESGIFSSGLKSNLNFSKKSPPSSIPSGSIGSSVSPGMRSASKIEMMSKEVAEKLLLGRPDRSWILRLNERGEKRITVVMSSKKFGHIKLHESAGGLFSLSPSSDDEEHLHTLLGKLQGTGDLGTQFFP